MTTKKSFKRSEPALAFISGAEEEASRPPKAKSTSKPAKKATATAPKSPKAKPTTKDREGAPEGYKLAPQYIETKSKRVQLLIQPSLYEEIRDRAEAEGLSVNEEIHNLLRQALGE